MGSAKKRVRQFLDHKGVSEYKICKDLKLSQGYFSKNGVMGVDRYLKIIRYFSDVNPDWILTGEGSMLKEDNENSSSWTEKENVFLKEKNQLLEEKIKLQDEINCLKEKIQRLECELNANQLGSQDRMVG